MTIEDSMLFFLSVSIIAVMYSSVGHAGATGYIAVMALFGMEPGMIKPIALFLNIIVACIAAFQFWKAGHFSWNLLWPFAVSSIPSAFAGGFIQIPDGPISIMIGVTLLYSALMVFFKLNNDNVIMPLSVPIAMTAGIVIGFLSGMIGIGGGVFLTPLILLLRWGNTKTAAAVSSVFILLNSISGLLGNTMSTEILPTLIIPIVIAAVIGGTAGSYLGSRTFSPVTIQRVLAIVLVVAGIKIIAL